MFVKRFHTYRALNTKLIITFLIHIIWLGKAVCVLPCALPSFPRYPKKVPNSYRFIRCLSSCPGYVIICPEQFKDKEIGIFFFLLFQRERNKTKYHYMFVRIYTTCKSNRCTFRNRYLMYRHRNKSGKNDGKIVVRIQKQLISSVHIARRDCHIFVG